MSRLAHGQLFRRGFFCCGHISAACLVIAMIGIMAWAVPALGQGTPTCLNGDQFYPPGILSHDYYGSGVVIDGNRAIVGAITSTVNNVPFAGAAYIYEYVNGAWVLDQEITRFFPVEDDSFGASVGISGDVAAIGAPGIGAAGTVFLYRRNSTTGNWEAEDAVTGSLAQAGDNYAGTLTGSHQGISLSSNILVVGAPGTNVNGAAAAGSVYVYRYDSTTDSWVEEIRLEANVPAAYSRFGYAVSTDSYSILVGAPVATGPGFVTIFDYDAVADEWDLSQEFDSSVSDPTFTDGFGFSVDLDRDRVLVGAPYGECAEIFDLFNGAWSSSQVLLGSGGHTGANFGYCVAFDGAVAIVGAPFSYHPTAVDGDGNPITSGAAYMFQYSLFGAQMVWSEMTIMYQTVTNAAYGDRTAECVAVDGDTGFVAALGDEPADWAAHNNDQNGQHGIVYILSNLPNCN